MLNKKNVAASLIVVVWLIWVVVRSLTMPIDIPTFHLDGSFQTASGLYRLHAGQWPGRDFMPYLGIGPLFLLFPVFSLMGSHLYASVFGAYLAVECTLVLSAALVLHLLTQRRSFLYCLAAASTLFLLPLALQDLRGHGLPQFLVASYLPGNSLRPLRSFAPYLMLGLFMVVSRYVTTPRRLAMASGVLAGAMMLWSNDFALPTTFVFSLYFLFSALRRAGGRWADAVVYVVALLLAWAVLLTIATVGSPLPLLHYNFVDVARDQWWYYGLRTMDNRIFSVSDLVRLLAHVAAYPVLLLAVMTVLAVVTRKVEHQWVACIGWIVFGGGVIPVVGGHIDTYFYTFDLWSLFCSVGLIASQGPRVAQGLNLSRDWPARAARVAGLLAFLLAAVSVATQTRTWHNKVTAARNDPGRFYVAELGGWLPQEWHPFIDFARQYKGTANEEYWGIFGATRHSFPTWPVDSAIHALGSLRPKAEAALPDTGLLITTRHSFSKWETWSLTQNYWFYRDIALHRRVVMYSPTTVAWAKDPFKQPPVEVSCGTQTGPDRFVINAPKPGYYELAGQVSGVTSPRNLILLETHMDVPTEIGNIISVDLNSGAFRTIVYAHQAGPASFAVTTIKPVPVQLSACHAMLLDVSDPQTFTTASAH